MNSKRRTELDSAKLALCYALNLKCFERAHAVLARLPCVNSGLTYAKCIGKALLGAAEVFDELVDRRHVRASECWHYHSFPYGIVNSFFYLPRHSSGYRLPA